MPPFARLLLLQWIVGGGGGGGWFVVKTIKIIIFCLFGLGPIFFAQEYSIMSYQNKSWIIINQGFKINLKKYHKILKFKHLTKLKHGKTWHIATVQNEQGVNTYAKHCFWPSRCTTSSILSSPSLPILPALLSFFNAQPHHWAFILFNTSNFWFFSLERNFRDFPCAPLDLVWHFCSFRVSSQENEQQD